MKKVFLIFLPVLILLPLIGKGNNHPTPNGWELISNFSSGSLYKSKLSDQITLSTFHEDGYVFGYNKIINTQDYFKGLSLTRKSSFAIGGLKNWKLEKVISVKKNNRSMELIFKGTYQRADDVTVQMYERHVFNVTHYYQTQIISNSDNNLLSEKLAIKTFEENKIESVF